MDIMEHITVSAYTKYPQLIPKHGTTVSHCLSYTSLFYTYHFLF